MPLFNNKFSLFLNNKSGATFMEYGLGFALLVGATAASMQTMNENIEKSFFCNTPDQRNMNKEECADHKSKYQQKRFTAQNEARDARLNKDKNQVETKDSYKKRDDDD